MKKQNNRVFGASYEMDLAEAADTWPPGRVIDFPGGVFSFLKCGKTTIAATNEGYVLVFPGKEGLKMVRWMSVTRISAGNGVPAMQHAKEMAEFAKKYEGVSSCSVYIDSFGETGTIRWFMDFDDLAAFEKVQSQALADEAYWKNLEKAKNLFIEGSNRTMVMREI